MSENPYIVDALLKVIRESGITHQDMARADDGHWFQVAALAEVNTPSVETRAMVLARLKERV